MNGNLAFSLIEKARAQQVLIGTAESCTGGLVAAAITEVPGAAAVFKGGIVSYSDDVKIQLLGVSPQTLASHGAVSEQTALEMAVGVGRALGVDLAVSVTGVAGPAGGTVESPVGTVWIAVADLRISNEQIAEAAAPQKPRAQAVLQHFSGDREQIRQAAVRTSLELLSEML